MKSNTLFAAVLTLVCITFVPILSYATVNPPPPRGAPFDGGLAALIAAGVAYASKKAYDKRKVNKKADAED